jgi:serine-aspartate repeat-containing protein C/D/E
VSLLRTVRNLARRFNLFDSAHSDPHERKTHLRICQVEELETRRAMAVAPIHLGSVYYEEASGDDSAPDVIHITFNGGAPGTQLAQLKIDTDKAGDGLSIGDMFWDISAGGKGSFNHVPLTIVSSNGFVVNSITLTDGGTTMLIDATGWDAGETLVISLDVDEQGFGNSTTAVAEGGEWEGTIMTGTFVSPNYETITGSAIYFDYYDDEFAAAAGTAGSALNLPPDNYNPPDVVNREDRTAGAVLVMQQIPKPIMLSGVVYHDRNQTVTQEAGEEGIAGVSLTLELWNGTTYVSTGKTAVTDANGAYKFNGLLPGKYRVVETQPSGWFSTGSKAGTVNGVTRGTTSGPDALLEITLDGGETSFRNDFGEILPAKISGHVHADPDGDCIVGPNDILLAGVKMELWNAQGVVIATTFTNAQGYYEFTGLVPGTYSVHEIQPAGYYDLGNHAGSVGGTVIGDLITQIVLQSGTDAVNYDFCEALPGEISGRVWADPQGDCNWSTGGIPLSGVTIELLDANNNVIRTTTTDVNGQYKFTDLAPGTYGVRETQPAGYFQGGTHVGSVGGVKGSDLVTQIIINSNDKGVNYDFCENLPASLSGRVWADPQGDCNWETGGIPLQGVIIQLFDAGGTLITTTLTDANGEYKFENLAPGTYTVHEVQPNGYYNGGTHVGSAGGVKGNDTISEIVLGSSVDAVRYDFCENIPASLSGKVWADANGDCIFQVGEVLLQGVKIELLSATGTVVATTFTNANGEYSFTNLAPGEYQVRETQPLGYFDSGEMAGSHGGVILTNDLISQILLKSGDDAVHYDFCEELPAQISGKVWADPQGDCNYETGGILLSGVRIDLLDANGNVIATTTTDANGHYEFTNLRSGIYGIREHQPAGYYNAGTHVGSAGGVQGSDLVTAIVLGAGVDAINYDFCENIPASIAGRVWVEVDMNCIYNAGEQLLAGVRVDLLDENGFVISTAFTDAQGAYKFVNLQPGKIYAVRETQPQNYFQGGTMVGSSGGVVPFDDNIKQIVLDSGEAAVDYDFCEIPQSKLSGYVFQDGPAVVIPYGTDPDIYATKTGIRGAGSIPIAGVRILLGDINGNPIYDEFGQPRIAYTDANGYYEFTGLRDGLYTVRQIQPDDYIDSIDRAGTTSGFPINLNIDPGSVPLFVLADILVPHNNDFIARINVPIGGASAENNFSEIKVVNLPPENPPPVIPPPPNNIPNQPYTPPGPGNPLTFKNILPYISSVINRLYIDGTGVVGNTWHLSVIDAGHPRTDRPDEAQFSMVSMLNLNTWKGVSMDSTQWTLATRDGQVISTPIFGNNFGIPVPGDYNGDGISEIAVFIKGEWFIDLNGNGKWDSDDLWAKLGTDEDLPVVGDWDGDGKDDIGIYGPAWPRDPEAIQREPGLPIVTNPNTGKSKNMPPLPEEATLGKRALKRTMTGKMRADFIDHVFNYGTAGDQPVAGDWTGQGSDAIGIFRNGAWHLDVNGDGKFTDADLSFTYGQAGDKGVVGDWDGDGVDDLGVYRDGTFILDTNNNHQLDADDLRVTPANGARGIPVAGDWDGDGRDEVGVMEVGKEVPTKAMDR